MRFPIALCIPSLLSLLACGTEPPSPPVGKFGAEALLEIDSASGALHIELRTDPQPPVVGMALAEYRVVDDDGAAVAGLAMDVTPYMPAMGMGTEVVPTVLEVEDGVYRVENVDLMMPGLWELRTQFTGAVDDEATPSFDVP